MYLIYLSHWVRVKKRTTNKISVFQILLPISSSGSPVFQISLPMAGHALRLVTAASRTPHHDSRRRGHCHGHCKLHTLRLRDSITSWRSHAQYVTKLSAFPVSTQVPFPPALKERQEKEAKGKGHPGSAAWRTRGQGFSSLRCSVCCTAPSTVYPILSFSELISIKRQLIVIPTKQNQAKHVWKAY